MAAGAVLKCYQTTLSNNWACYIAQAYPYSFGLQRLKKKYTRHEFFLVCPAILTMLQTFDRE